MRNWQHISGHVGSNPAHKSGLTLTSSTNLVVKIRPCWFLKVTFHQEAKSFADAQRLSYGDHILSLPLSIRFKGPSFRFGEETAEVLSFNI